MHVHAAWDSEEEARAVGEEIEQPPAPAATSSTTWRSWCAPPSRCASSRTASSRSASTTASSAARASTSAMEIRDALAYLPRRRARRRRPRLRAHRQRAQARPWRIHHPPDPRHRARAAHPDAGGRRQARRKRRAEAEAARRTARGRRQFRALAEGCSKPRRTPSSPRPSSRRAATPTCGRTTARPKRRAGWKT